MVPMRPNRLVPELKKQLFDLRTYDWRQVTAELRRQLSTIHRPTDVLTK